MTDKPTPTDAVALARYKVVPAHESMFHRFAVVAGDGKQQLYLGREVECENMARKFAGAFLDGAFYQANITPSTQAAGSVPAVEREQERIAFKDAHQHLELYEVPDAWGRPMFKHSHVEASWLGWIARASHGQAPSGATEEVENLRKALVYAAFALHDTPQYMLAQGMTLIDGDTVRVSRDGWTVEASVNPHRQPAPAETGNSVSAQTDSVLEDAARVFTYKNQPCDNVNAWRFGEACRAAQPGGDPIDHGLSLLQKLQERGYGIVAIDAARKQGEKQ